MHFLSVPIYKITYVSAKIALLVQAQQEGWSPNKMQQMFPVFLAAATSATAGISTADAGGLIVILIKVVKRTIEIFSNKNIPVTLAVQQQHTTDIRRLPDIHGNFDYFLKETDVTEMGISPPILNFIYSQVAEPLGLKGRFADQLILVILEEFDLTSIWTLLGSFFGLNDLPDTN